MPVFLINLIQTKLFQNTTALITRMLEISADCATWENSAVRVRIRKLLVSTKYAVLGTKYYIVRVDGLHLNASSMKGKMDEKGWLRCKQISI
jgi:hypothetical protein